MRPNRSVDHNTSVVYAWFNELPPTPKVAQKTGVHLSRTPGRQRSYHRPAWRPHDATANAQQSQRIGTQACGKNNERFGVRLMLHYPIQLEDDDDAVLATSPDFPELTTFGVDRDEAVARAAYALEEAIAARIHDGKDIPLPSSGPDYAVLSTLTAVKVMLYRGMKEQGIGKAELARRLGWHLPQVDRVLNLRHHSRLDQMDAALTAIGRRLNVSVS